MPRLRWEYAPGSELLDGYRALFLEFGYPFFFEKISISWWKMVSNSFYFQPGHWGHDPFGRIFFNLGWSHLAYIHFDNFEKFCLLPLGLIYAILVHACSTWLRFVDPLDEKVYGIHLPRQRVFFWQAVRKSWGAKRRKRRNLGTLEPFCSARQTQGEAREPEVIHVCETSWRIWRFFASPSKMVVEVVGVFL